MGKNKTARVSKKSLTVTIETWKGADVLTGEVGDLQLKINQALHIAKGDIDEIKAELVEKVEPYHRRIKALLAGLEAFAVSHKKDFGKKRSRKLNFGVLGWRKSTPIKVITKQSKKNPKTTLELIKKLFTAAMKKSCLRCKETVDKDALAKLTDKQLERVGARRDHKEVFFVEPALPEAVDYE